MTATAGLWIIFLALQVFGAGNVNYQQDQGYYEINPIYHIWGDTHPSKEQVYITKAVETGIIWGATEIWPEYENGILVFASSVSLCFRVSDSMKGIAFKMRF